MRSNIERAEAVRRRASELRRLRARRLSRIAAAGGSLANLAVIVALAFALPAADFSAAIEGSAGAGGIFASAAAGYIIVGVLAFALGAAVTVLCFKLRSAGGRGGEDRDDRDNR